MVQYLSYTFSLSSVALGRSLWKTISTSISALAVETASDQVRYHHTSLNIEIAPQKTKHIVRSTHQLRIPQQHVGAS